jgi:hypothetical protein
MQVGLVVSDLPEPKRPSGREAQVSGTPASSTFCGENVPCVYWTGRIEGVGTAGVFGLWWFHSSNRLTRLGTQ